MKKCEILTEQETLALLTHTLEGVSYQAFQTRLLEYAKASGQVQRRVNHPPGALYSPVLGNHNFDGPTVALVHAIRPVLGHLLNLRANGLHFDDHVSNAVLDFRMVSHRTR